MKLIQFGTIAKIGPMAITIPSVFIAFLNEIQLRVRES